MSVVVAETSDSDVSWAFRAAMRRVASTVAVITTQHAGQPYGMTATAVTSLTTSPASVLVCVNNTASIRCPIVEEGRFCVNFLASRDSELCTVFSGAIAGPDRFRHGDWKEGMMGLPVLASADAALFCEVERSDRYHSHTIFIGRVVEVETASSMPDPLMYCAGRIGHFEGAR